MKSSGQNGGKTNILRSSLYLCTYNLMTIILSHQEILKYKYLSPSLCVILTVPLKSASAQLLYILFSIYNFALCKSLRKVGLLYKCWLLCQMWYLQDVFVYDSAVRGVPLDIQQVTSTGKKKSVCKNLIGELQDMHFYSVTTSN